MERLLLSLFAVVLAAEVVRAEPFADRVVAQSVGAVGGAGHAS